jgi:hypothetical protein
MESEAQHGLRTVHSPGQRHEGESAARGGGYPGGPGKEWGDRADRRCVVWKQLPLFVVTCVDGLKGGETALERFERQQVGIVIAVGLFVCVRVCGVAV